MGDPVVHFEMHCADAQTLGKFYSELFGWQTQHSPELSYVTIDTASGGGINGGIGDNPEAPAKTTVYVATLDLDAKLEKIQSLGGKTLAPPTEIPNIVTFAIFQDPQGNALGLVKADPDQAAPPVTEGSNPPIDWFEIYGTDPNALQEFYAKAFGWKVTTSDSGGFEYHHFDTGAGGINGAVTADPSRSTRVVLWAKVDDPAKFQDRAKELGAEIVMPPREVSGDLEVAIIKDPDDNLFGLYRSTRSR